jgi:hypothetical protein
MKNYMSLEFLRVYIQKCYQNPNADFIVDVTSYWEFLVTSFHIRPLRSSARRKHDSWQIRAGYRNRTVPFSSPQTYVLVCYSRRLRWKRVAVRLLTNSNKHVIA